MWEALAMALYTALGLSRGLLCTCHTWPGDWSSQGYFGVEDSATGVRSQLWDTDLMGV